MAINRNITGINVDDGADNNKVPLYNSTTKSFDMTTSGIVPGELVFEAYILI